MILVSVDCGVRGCGVAVFIEAKLACATYVRSGERRGRGANIALAMAQEVARYVDLSVKSQPHHLAIETMQWYDAASQLGDQNDLGAVQLVAGAITGILGCSVTSYIPREWKGTIDGDTCTERILERLRPEEREAIVRVSDTVDHNTIDGIGIGLKYLGRFETRRTFARE